jgi:hypothetical protein
MEEKRIEADGFGPLFLCASQNHNPKRQQGTKTGSLADASGYE